MSAGRPHLVVYTDAPGIGGAEEVLVTLLRGIGERFRITLVGTSATVLAHIAAAGPELPCVTVPAVRDKADLGPIVAHIRTLRRLKPDVCHINLRTPYDAQYGLLAALLGPGRVVAVEHLPLPSDSPLKRWIKRRTSRRLDGHVAVGERAARAVEQDARLPPGSVRVLRNGVPARTTRRRDDAARSGRTRIVAVGRLDVQKGFDVLIRALPMLPELTVTVIGEGAERDALQTLARELGVAGRFELAGRRACAAELLPDYDALVLPSRNEGLPLVVLEAMEAGLPVVASDVGSVSEAVEHEETGLLVPPGDSALLAAAIERVLEDEETHRRLSTNARAAWAARFDARRMVEDYVTLYRSVLR